MKIEDIKKLENECHEARETLENARVKLSEAKKEYMKENTPFKKGDKVKDVRNNEFFIFEEATEMWYGEITWCDCRKIKNDGTPYAVTVGLSIRDLILVNE